jgi:hypothetical protein
MTKLQTYRLSYCILTAAVVVWSISITKDTSCFELMAWCFFMILAMNCWVSDMLTKGKDGC